MADDVTKRHVDCARILSPTATPFSTGAARLSSVPLPSSVPLRPSCALLFVAAAENATPEAALLLRLLDFPVLSGLGGRDRRVRRRARGARRGGRQAHGVGRNRDAGVLAEDAGQTFRERGSVERTDFGRLRAAHEILGVDHRALLDRPSRLTTATLSQPPVGSLPDIRHTFSPTTLAGRSNQSGLSPRVARFMNAAQMGTASSPA